MQSRGACSGCVDAPRGIRCQATPLRHPRHKPWPSAAGADSELHEKPGVLHTTTSQANGQTARSVRVEYDTLARSYERRWRHYLDISSVRTLAALNPRNQERILDAGCGTGALLRRIAACAPGAHLVGIDLTAAMLRQADQTLSDLLLGDIRRLPFANGCLDAMVLASVLQYQPDLDTTVAEAARVLRPDGRVVITLWDSESRRVRLLGCWLRWRNRADVRLYTLGEVSTSCRERGLSIRQVYRYPAGRLWRLVTVLATKTTDGRGDDGSVR